MEDTMTDCLDVSLDGDALRVGDLRITFQRTLRIPDDGKTYPLPPGLGAFPLRRIDDLGDRAPAAWREKGGVILPMYQREAMWLCFSGPHWKPSAVKIAAGKVCAITGKRWSDALHDAPQDYLVTPPQPWLDGIAVKKGLIRQFVAMPLGMGYTIEGQVTGEETHGGVQIRVVPPRPGRFPDEPPYEEERLAYSMCEMACAAPAAPRRCGGAMGLAAGGRMKQKIYDDPHGLDTWDETRAARVFVHVVNSQEWRALTGEEPPPCPIDARTYTAHGLPWFDLYDEHIAAVDGSDVLAQVKSVKHIDAGKSTLPLQGDDPVSPTLVRKLKTAVARGLRIRDGRW
jgi:hypothetical protein